MDLEARVRRLEEAGATVVEGENGGTLSAPAAAPGPVAPFCEVTLPDGTRIFRRRATRELARAAAVERAEAALRGAR